MTNREISHSNINAYNIAYIFLQLGWQDTKNWTYFTGEAAKFKNY